MIATDIEFIGYKNFKITPTPTDVYIDKTNSGAARIQVDLKKPIVIDLGHGRQITIRFHANKSTLSVDSIEE